MVNMNFRRERQHENFINYIWPVVYNTVVLSLAADLNHLSGSSKCQTFRGRDSNMQPKLGTRTLTGALLNVSGMGNL